MPTNLWTTKLLWQSDDTPYYRLEAIINGFDSVKDAIDFGNAPNPDLFICDNDIEKNTTALILWCADKKIQLTDEQVNVYKYDGVRDGNIDETLFCIVDIKIDDYYQIIGLDRGWESIGFKVLDPQGKIYKTSLL